VRFEPLSRLAELAGAGALAAEGRRPLARPIGDYAAGDGPTISEFLRTYDAFRELTAVPFRLQADVGQPARESQHDCRIRQLRASTNSIASCRYAR